MRQSVYSFLCRQTPPESDHVASAGSHGSSGRAVVYAVSSCCSWSHDTALWQQGVVVTFDQLRNGGPPSLVQTGVHSAARNGLDGQRQWWSPTTHWRRTTAWRRRHFQHVTKAIISYSRIISSFTPWHNYPIATMQLTDADKTRSYL